MNTSTVSQTVHESASNDSFGATLQGAPFSAAAVRTMLEKLQDTHEQLCARINPAAGLQSLLQKKVGALLLCAGHTLELLARTCDELEQCQQLLPSDGHRSTLPDGQQALLTFNEAVIAKTTSVCAPILKSIIDDLHRAAEETLTMNPWEITASNIERKRLNQISQDLVASNLQLEITQGGQETLAEGLRTIDAQVYEATTRRILDRMSIHGEEIVSLARYDQDARLILRQAVRRGKTAQQLLRAFLALSKDDWIRAFALALDPITDQLAVLQDASSHTAATLKAWYR